MQIEKDYILRLIYEIIRTLLHVLFQIDIARQNGPAFEDEQRMECGPVADASGPGPASSCPTPRPAPAKRPRHCAAARPPAARAARPRPDKHKQGHAARCEKNGLPPAQRPARPPPEPRGPSISPAGDTPGARPPSACCRPSCLLPVWPPSTRAACLLSPAATSPMVASA